MPHDEMSFSELRRKEVINEVDGRRLGRICDMVFSPTKGHILGIVAPFQPRGMFFKGQEVFIPFKCICKIGPDIILVKLTPELSHRATCYDIHCKDDKKEPHHDGHHDNRHHDNRHHDKCNCERCRHGEKKKEPDCDGRCEKCMLFDCARRWSFG